LKEEPLQVHCDANIPEPAICNEHGLTLAILPGHAYTLKQKIIELQTQKKINKNNTPCLQGQVGSLTASLDTYKVMRQYFICTYKRDISKTATDKDHQMITDGYKSVHARDSIIDAQYYQGIERRHDRYNFQQLYGFLPKTVITFSMYPFTLSTLIKITLPQF